jgi:hypothetical protein
MVIDVVVRMAEAELETLSAIDDSLTKELLLAKKFGSKAEVENLRKSIELNWARYEQLSTFITNVKYELERVGA